MTKTFHDVFYRSADDLSLYARDYPGPGPDAPVVLALHGLSRNSRDFADLADHLAARYRVIVPDIRGRGLSDYDPEPLNYIPATYVMDMAALQLHLGVERLALIGTSLGGIMAMAMTALNPDAVVGVVLNDVGPVVDPEGIARIQSYVGKTNPPLSWAEAEEQTRGLNAEIFPDFSPADWYKFTRSLYREDNSYGRERPVLDYDPLIAQSLAEGDAVPPDLWDLFEALAAKPVLVIRGEMSDILSRDTLAEMQSRHPGLETVTVPKRGHAPLLTEPVAQSAIDGFLARIF
ncbi:alpha/beta fold hydrolase [Govanella unica]|uniref:Alpha/beta hydrolase n=1 Tax=Govanella unica TaxID=2975056 RepID=A0A9X3Z7J9_9PROT|nr:alpha/beta hydrolase [Govania unica]MDA5194236.1 alpha/beta hydrolase [Govania unica]